MEGGVWTRVECEEWAVRRVKPASWGLIHPMWCWTPISHSLTRSVPEVFLVSQSGRLSVTHEMIRTTQCSVNPPSLCFPPTPIPLSTKPTRAARRTNSTRFSKTPMWFLNWQRDSGNFCSVNKMLLVQFFFFFFTLLINLAARIELNSCRNFKKSQTE